MFEDGTRVNGNLITESIANMHERSNGLGGGFAAYGVYPDFADCYAFHLMCSTRAQRTETETFLKRTFEIRHEEEIPTRAIAEIRHRPILRRYFVVPTAAVRKRLYDLTADDIVADAVMTVNRTIEGALIFSSGKNMGVFKGVGYPEDISRFFRLEEYDAHIWIAHGRFPTNTTGWWGGAHPFGILNWAVVHNGEVSSYGINRRYLANFGYQCTMFTDTEVIAYLFDLLMRKHALPLDVACMALAPPFWSQIERMDPDRRRLAQAVRVVYGGALLNGPFSVVVSNGEMMLGFNDRIKLRPMTAARKGDALYVASEEAAIRVICPDPDRLWHAVGGEPVVGRLKGVRVEEVAA